MARWRYGRGWSELELKVFLADLGGRIVNFDVTPSQMTRENGWTIDGASVRIGSEPPGPPLEDGLFTRARQALINYDFSDPTIVVGHYDANAPLVGRNMLLEIKVWGFHFLNGVRVHGVREEAEAEADADATTFGFRYDTLEGHIERGYEWFLLRKEHASGVIDFTIEAHWRLGDFPNLWSKVGFKVIGERYRALWRDRAAERLRRLAFQPASEPVAVPGALAHRGDETPRRTESTELVD